MGERGEGGKGGGCRITHGTILDHPRARGLNTNTLDAEHAIVVTLTWGITSAPDPRMVVVKLKIDDGTEAEPLPALNSATSSPSVLVAPLSPSLGEGAGKRGRGSGSVVSKNGIVWGLPDTWLVMVQRGRRRAAGGGRGD